MCDQVFTYLIVFLNQSKLMLICVFKPIKVYIKLSFKRNEGFLMIEVNFFI
jgi:hypothetical protein